MVDLDELEKLAKAASPGPWEWHGGGCEYSRLEAPKAKDWSDRTVLNAESGTVYSEYSSDPASIGCSEQNAAFIAAANPATIIELIERLRRAENR